MQIKSKIAFVLLLAILFQPMVLLAADTQTATNLTIKTAGDGTVTTAASNPNLSAPSTTNSTAPPALTGATKATIVPRRLCSDYMYYGPNARPEHAGGDNYQCPVGYECHWNGLLLECRAAHNQPQPDGPIMSTGPQTVIYQDEWRCRTEFCGSHG